MKPTGRWRRQETSGPIYVQASRGLHETGSWEALGKLTRNHRARLAVCDEKVTTSCWTKPKLFLRIKSTDNGYCSRFSEQALTAVNACQLTCGQEVSLSLFRRSSPARHLLHARLTCQPDVEFGARLSSFSANSWTSLGELARPNPIASTTSSSQRALPFVRRVYPKLTCGFMCAQRPRPGFILIAADHHLTPKPLSKFLQNALRARRYHGRHERSAGVPLTPNHKDGPDRAHAKTRGPNPSGTRHTGTARNRGFSTCARPV